MSKIKSIHLKINAFHRNFTFAMTVQWYGCELTMLANLRTNGYSTVVHFTEYSDSHWRRFTLAWNLWKMPYGFRYSWTRTGGQTCVLGCAHNGIQHVPRDAHIFYKNIHCVHRKHVSARPGMHLGCWQWWYQSICERNMFKPRHHFNQFNKSLPWHH